MGGRKIQFQQKAALGQTDAFRGKGPDPNTPVGCQTVLFSPVQDGADASAESAPAKRNVGDRDHDGARLRKIVALHPQIGAGEGGAAVLFDIPLPAAEAVQMPVHSDAAPEGVRHAEHAVPALHGKKPERAHDVGGKRRKRPVGNVAADAGQIYMAAPL